jgi:hypothetical protein
MGHRAAHGAGDEQVSSGSPCVQTAERSGGVGGGRETEREEAAGRETEEGPAGS